MAIVAILDDLVFRSKIEKAAAHLRLRLDVAGDATSAVQQLSREPCSLIVIDLNGSTSDPIELMKTLRQLAPATPIVGYCSHLQSDLQARARAAGCSVVLPRSAFVQRLPALLQAAAQDS